MALSRPGRGFIETIGRTLGTKAVLVSPGEIRPDRAPKEFEAQVQAAKAFFDITTPVYEGDLLEWDDPRGGRKTVYAALVKVNDAGGDAADLAHIAVTFADSKPSVARAASGHHIEVRGNNINLAINGSTITQQMAVSPEWMRLADDVGRALALIEETPDLDDDEVGAARDAATVLLEEVAKSDPDTKVVKRLLPTIRGVLQSAANAGAAAGAAALVGQLFV